MKVLVMHAHTETHTHKQKGMKFNRFNFFALFLQTKFGLPISAWLLRIHPYSYDWIFHLFSNGCFDFSILKTFTTFLSQVPWFHLSQHSLSYLRFSVVKVIFPIRADQMDRKYKRVQNKGHLNQNFKNQQLPPIIYVQEQTCCFSLTSIVPTYGGEGRRSVASNIFHSMLDFTADSLFGPLVYETSSSVIT